MWRQGFDGQKKERRLTADVRLVHCDWVGATVHVKEEVLKAWWESVVVFNLSGHPEVRLAGVRVQTGAVQPFLTAVVSSQDGIVLVV